MPAQLVHVGFGNVVAMNKVVAIVSPTSAPIKRLVQEGKNTNLIIDMTSGRRTRSVMVTDSGHLILAAVSAETIAGRLLTTRVASRSPAEAEV